MTSNKERIEHLEVGLGSLQDNLSRMELGLADRLHRMEDTLHKLSQTFLSTNEASNSNSNERHRRQSPRDEPETGERPIFTAKTAKLDFPRFSGEDPTEWMTRVEQFFEYQGTVDTHKVSLASYHLEGEANQWWQWL